MWFLLFGLLLLPVNVFAQVSCYTPPNGLSTTCSGPNSQTLEIYRNPNGQSGSYLSNDGSNGSYNGSGNSMTISPSQPTMNLQPSPLPYASPSSPSSLPTLAPKTMQDPWGLGGMPSR